MARLKSINKSFLTESDSKECPATIQYLMECLENMAERLRSLPALALKNHFLHENYKPGVEMWGYCNLLVAPYGYPLTLREFHL